MPYSTRIALGFLVVAVGTAEAQISPGGGMPGGGAQQPSGETKKEGVAEAAPKTTGLLPTTPALPAPKSRRKRWKLLEMDGYFRLRTDWFKNFNLGFVDIPALGGAPFPRALNCSASPTINAGCDNSLSSANMRLRLEPTINLNEGTSIHIQADILDNEVLGATPFGEQLNGVYNDVNLPPLGAFSNSQGVPIAGLNSDRDSILIKRAWAEVALPLGILKAGRMPNHWGLGMLYNGGGYDPVSGVYDYEADYGDSVDRVSFSAGIPGTNLRAMIASDWTLTRLVSNQTNANKGQEGHPFDLDDEDDTNAWVGVISRMDSPQEFRDKVDRGEVAFNYGVYFEYRRQSFEDDLRNFVLGGPFDAATRYVPRHLTMYSPDVWARLGIGKFLLEAEFAAQLGKVERLDEYGVNGGDIRKFGGVGRLTWRGMEGKLRLGLESGAASGNQWDNNPPGRTNIAFSTPWGGPGNPNDLTQFIFNRAYRVDEILFRYLIGAVTNAAYIKPSVAYDFTKSIGFRVANVTSFALKPVATPGNSTMYGTEFDAEVGYRANGISASLVYGVLFPFGALNHPENTSGTGGSFGFSNDPDNPAIRNIGDASTAHTIQARLVLSF